MYNGLNGYLNELPWVRLHDLHGHSTFNKKINDAIDNGELNIGIFHDRQRQH